MTAPVSARLVAWHAFTRDGVACAFLPGQAGTRSLCGAIRRQPLIFAHPERRRCEPCGRALAERRGQPAGMGL